MALLQDFGRWQWRLIPANPILVRVVHGASRRTRHLYIRGAYLLVLLGVMLLAKLVLQQGGPQSLDDLARSNCQVFMWISRVQLAMICLIAPVFAAGAITQERDAQTYNILLSTPLSNAQIVLGSLLSRLYFVIVLLLSGLPIFCITMLYGGVTQDQILLSSALAGCTAVVTAALAIAMSLIKTGSRQTMFSFYGIVGLYLVIVYGLSRRPRPIWTPGCE
jgi:ABC-2 type transport system permease protein